MMEEPDLEDLEIPEEPTEEEELKDLKEEEANQKKTIQHQDTQDSQSSVIGFMTAVKIARWMARAYGYTAKKRKTFLIEAKVLLRFLYFLDHFLVLYFYFCRFIAAAHPTQTLV